MEDDSVCYIRYKLIGNDFLKVFRGQQGRVVLNTVDGQCTDSMQFLMSSVAQFEDFLHEM